MIYLSFFEIVKIHTATSEVKSNLQLGHILDFLNHGSIQALWKT